jgi:class 3 adenylate cyclase
VVHEKLRVVDEDNEIMVMNGDTINEKIKLLQQLLPYGFDDAFLQKTRKYIKYKSCCILFTDVVSYCELAETYTDTIIYMMLNEMYSKFDVIIQKYQHLQKIETIGDAYLVVGDLNSAEYNDRIVIEILYFALEIMDEMKTIRTPTHKLQIRIGIHIGNFIISVLGKINPRLCIIGKNINKTARLQSTARPETIQISAELFDIASHIPPIRNLMFYKNEKVYLKNIGYTHTYTVKKT